MQSSTANPFARSAPSSTNELIATTAGKEHCRQVWTSYGVWDEIHTFLDRKLVLTRHQALNRFCYNIATSRVQTRIQLKNDSVFYFIDCQVGSEKASFVIYDEKLNRTRFELIPDSKRFLGLSMTIQVKFDLFAFLQDCERPALMKVQRIGSDFPKYSKMASPRQRRSYPSLAVSKQKSVIYVAGGTDAASVFSSVHAYDIEKDAWLESLPDMNTPRYSHSSCTLGSSLYVFLGLTSGSQFIKSVERLDLPSERCSASSLASRNWVELNI